MIFAPMTTRRAACAPRPADLALQRFLMAASWGGYESLVFPVAGVRDWVSLSASASVPINLVRCSIGLEAPDVLIADLERGFAAI